METCSGGDSDGGDSVKHRVDEVVDDLLDKSSVLAVSASLLSPLLAHPSCQESLTEAVKMVADAAEKTGVLTQVQYTLHCLYICTYVCTISFFVCSPCAAVTAL